MKHKFVALLVCTALTALAGSAASAAPKSAASDSYVLGPGDQIEVSIYGEPDLSRTAVIKPDGTIALALVNEVRASGKTTGQLETELTKMYARYLKAPSITVVVRELRVDRVYLLGQVNKPGEYQLRPNVGIFELLAGAGGLTNRADLARAVVIRDKTETVKLDLVEAFAKNQTPNVKLQTGDVLFIPETDRRITVLGEVTKAGAYEMLEGQRVTQLLAAAGGLTAKASLSKAFIMRDNTQMPIDLKRILAGDVEANVALKPGDMLVVPESKDRVTILGAVHKPGPYDLAENMTLLDVIALAGGPTDKGSLGNIQIVRLEGGKTTTLQAKADQAMQGKDASQNLKLQTGDLVFVPESGMNLFDILNIGSLFRLIFFR